MEEIMSGTPIVTEELYHKNLERIWIAEIWNNFWHLNYKQQHW